VGSLFFLNKSFWIFIVQGLLSIFNPNSIDYETKIKIFESGIDTSITYLRSEGFSATYDDFYDDKENNIIVLENLVIKKEFEPQYSGFCLEENIVPKSIWHSKSCEFSLEIDKIKFTGLNLGYKSEGSFKIDLIGIKHDLSIYNNTELMTLKKLVELDDYLFANFYIETQYEFSKNIFKSNVNLDIQEFGVLNFSLTANDIIYNQDKFSFNLDKFNLMYEDNSLINKIEILRELNLLAYDGFSLHESAKKKFLKQPNLNVNDVSELEKINLHNDFINSLNYHYPNYEENIVNLILFLKDPGTIYCQNDSDHIINELFLDEVGNYGLPLLVAALCENITYESYKE
tara:strand:- start:1315 stop:2346 length:1032 start_codon:yes stop_codon:yes gene_type:complete